MRSLIFAAVALVVGAMPAAAKVLVTVDKSAQQMTVTVDGVRRWTWPVSTGVPRYDTPSGRYTAFRMEKDHFSKEWDDAPMPHSIFFTPRGHAIHGYLNTRNIGNPASHGCVRLNPAHAAQLFALVKEQGLPNTTVVLTGDVQVAMARKATRTATARAAAPPPGAPTALQPAADMGYPAPRYGAQGYATPRYEAPGYEAAPPATYGRVYDNCPPPPPGFPAPACSYARPQARADAPYPPRRYDYGQPQYEPDPPPVRRYPFGGY